MECVFTRVILSNMMLYLFLLVIAKVDGTDYYADVTFIRDTTLINDHRGMMDAFKYAVKTVNQDLRHGVHTIEIQQKIEPTEIDNSFLLTKEICKRLLNKTLVIVADSSPQSIEVYESISNRLRVPIILPRGPGYIHKSPFLFDMMPSYTGAIIDYVRYFGWKVVYYIYDSEESLLRIQEIYRAQSRLGINRFSLKVHKITDINDSYAVLRGVDRNRFCDTDFYHLTCNMRIILDLSSREAYNLTLEQIINVGMNRDEYHYILGGLVIRELDLSAFEYGGVNITGFSMLDTHSKQYNDLRTEDNRNSFPYLNDVERDNPFTVDKAMMVDAIRIIGAGAKKYVGNDKTISKPTQSKCNSEFQPDSHTLGSMLADSIKKVNDVKGLTGKVAFDANGHRKDYTLEVHQMGYKSTLKKIGDWSPNRPEGQRFSTDLPSSQPFLGYGSLQSNRTWRIATKISPPFVQKVTSIHTDKKSEGVTEIDGKLYEGYCIELIQKIEARYSREHGVKFKYKMHLVGDNQFGSVNETTRAWNGMIGEIVRNETDLALASLTITEIRQRVVDFTTPFMQMGISIMIKKPDKQKPGVFSFMDPLNKIVWICVMIGFLAVSLVLFFVGRWSPYEWRKIENSRDQSNAFTFSNTLWFALGALMQQGSDIFPRSISGRVVGSAWWFFTLILISSYTANLAAFLTIERLLTPIRGPDDLVEQSKIAYGGYKKGATEQYFRQSKVTTFAKMWKYMEANYDKVMQASDDEGVKRVRDSKGDYAYLLESPRNTYESQKQPCNTMKVGDNLVNKGYGIATHFNLAELRKNLTLVILKLSQEGVLYRLEQRWWYDKGECGTESKDSTKSPLTLSNVSGIFHILIGGLVIAMSVALFEFIIHSLRRKHKERYRAPVKSSVKIEKKNPLEVLKAAGYSEMDNSGVHHFACGPPEYDQLKTFGDGANGWHSDSDNQS